MGKTEKKQQQQEVQNLIPGLPDEIAMECLIRVPYKFHNDLKSVCQRWLNLISSHSFYRERIRSGKAEHLVCQVQPLPLSPPNPKDSSSATTHLVSDSAAKITSTKKDQQQDDDDHELHQQRQEVHRTPLQYGLTIFNASNGTWERIRPHVGRIPMFCQCVAVPASRKLLLIGGWDPITLEPVPDVYVLDMVNNSSRWRRAKPMSVARSFFACAVVGALTVCVAGGHDGQKNALKSAEVYDVEADEWRMLPEMDEERDECQGVCLEGDRFFVVSGYGTESQGRFKPDAECYDPTTGSWSKFDHVWPFPSLSPRGSTATITSNRLQQHQWLWFLGKEQQQNGEVVEGKIVSSIVPLPKSVTEGSSSPCVSVTTLHNSQQQQKVFVMTGNGGRGCSSSSSAAALSSFICNECEGEGAFIMERDMSNGNIKWDHVHLPVGFSGFPCSASFLLI